MLRYKLRTLLILLAILPPMLAGGYWVWIWMVAEPPPHWPAEQALPMYINGVFQPPGVTWEDAASLRPPSK